MTDGDGNVGGIVDGGGAITNPQGSHKTVGSYSVTAITFKQSNGTSDLTTEQKNYLAGKTAVFTDVLSGKGQVQLVSDDAGATEIEHDTLTIVFAAGFDATLSKVTCTFTNGKFCIRTNNESGLEYVKSTGAGSSYSTNVIGDTSSNGSSSGQKGYLASGANQYKIQNWNGTAWEDTVGTWLHDADKLAIGEVSATPTPTI